MATASFNDIRKKISSNIIESKEIVLVSVAWFTSKDLLGKLTDRLEDGCKVEIIISDHHENKRLNYNDFIKKGGQVFIVPVKSGKFLHDKFAIFDNKKIIAGSYNWTNSAEFYNHEFIIESDETGLIDQFEIRFKILKEIVIKYDKLELLSNDYLNSEIANKEEEFIKLEQELENEFLNSIKEANKLGAKINATNVISFIHRYGAIGAANRLINSGTDKLQSGLLKLWELQKLDISFEKIIQKDKYKVLFDKDIREKAKKRLDELK
jgi:phosphatidylserine/phosphatidylglycerophosphate/cardiolipin synthase-like enzyme